MPTHQDLACEAFHCVFDGVLKGLDGTLAKIQGMIDNMQLSLTLSGDFGIDFNLPDFSLPGISVPCFDAVDDDLLNFMRGQGVNLPTNNTEATALLLKDSTLSKNEKVRDLLKDNPLKRLARKQRSATAILKADGFSKSVLKARELIKSMTAAGCPDIASLTSQVDGIEASLPTTPSGLISITQDQTLQSAIETVSEIL